MTHTNAIIIFVYVLKLVLRLLYKVEFVQSVLTRALYNLSLVFIDFRIQLVIHFVFLCLYLQFF